ncbi:hypothetical protein AB0D16_33060 [Streptomyces sp. NPDC048161]|uniref:hypothetical protein n=1 Tax=unclassified Streptomyces TaxID=2593676 RepID=UPI00340EB9AA
MIHDLLCWQVREGRGRSEDPSAIVTGHPDRARLSQCAEGDDRAGSGQVEPRGIATDVLGLLIAVAASVHDNAIGIALLDRVAADNPSVTKGWVDAGFKDAVVGHGTALGIDIEVVQRDPGASGVHAGAQAVLHRRPARDYETLPAGSALWIRWSMTDVMTRRAPATPRLPGAIRHQSAPEARPAPFSFLGEASYSATIRSLYSGLKVWCFDRGAGSDPVGLVITKGGSPVMPSQANPTKRDVSPKTGREGLDDSPHR